MDDIDKIFDLLTKSYKELYGAYGDIDESFGCTGSISTAMEDTLDRLKKSIMYLLGWKLDTAVVNGTIVDIWTNEYESIDLEAVDKWFSSYGFELTFEERMVILYNMSHDDAFSRDIFNSQL